MYASYDMSEDAWGSYQAPTEICSLGPVLEAA